MRLLSQVSSQMLVSLRLHPLLSASGLSPYKPHTGLIAEQEALPWHHFDTQVFLIQAQGELLQLKPNCLQFSS